MDASGVAPFVAMFAMTVVFEVILAVVLVWLGVPFLHGYQVAGRLNGSYAGNLYSDRRTVIVLTRGPGERAILLVRPECTEPISSERLWEMHEAGDVRWFDSGFETFEASIRSDEAAHPTVAAGLVEHRHRVNRRMWPVAVIAFLVLAVILYIEVVVLHVSFPRI